MMQYHNFLILLLLIPISSAFVAFDCNHENSNITTLSMLDVKECTLPYSELHEELVPIQLLQLRELGSSHVYTCKISVTRLILRCSAWDDSQIVKNGFNSYLYPLSHDDCLNIHKKRKFAFNDNTVYNDIPLNTSTSFSDVIAGSLSESGDCTGDTFRSSGNIWKDVTVTVTLTIELYDYIAQIRVNTDEIILRSGVVCSYSSGSCLDSTVGFTAWNYFPTEQCTSTTYDVLYQGLATKTISIDALNHSQTIYTVKSEDILFALSLTSSHQLCMYQGWKTEHPKLSIIEVPQQNYYFIKSPLSATNLDLFLYFNTKFVYVEKHIKRQITNLHKHYLMDKCDIHRKLLLTQLTIARTNPSEFAYLYMQQPGYTASKMGEVIKLTQCQAVDVSLESKSTCYDEVPVKYNGKSMFMTPVTHLLVEYGNQIDCSTIMSPSFFLNNKWYGLYPQLHAIAPPHKLDPNGEEKWKYDDIGDLANSGLYTSQDLQRLKKQLMFSNERSAIENIMSRGAVGSDTDLQNLRIINLIPEHELHSQIKNAWNTLWGIVTIFGTISAGGFGVIMIVKIIKNIIDTTIHCRDLNREYTSKWVLMAGFWDSLTQYLINKKMRQRARDTCQGTEVDQLLQVTTDLIQSNSDPNRANHDDVINRQPINRPSVYPILPVFRPSDQDC